MLLSLRLSEPRAGIFVLPAASIAAAFLARRIQIATPHRACSGVSTHPAREPLSRSVFFRCS